MKKIALALLSTTVLFSLTIEEAVQRGINNSSLVKNANSQIAIDALGVELAGSHFLPKVDGNYIYTLRDKEIASSEKSFGVINLSAQVNLFNGMSDYFAKESAKDSLKIAQLEKKATVADLALTIKESFINHLNAKMELENLQASLDLLNEQFKRASLQLEQGIISIDELLKVEVSKLSVEKDLLQAHNKVATSWLRLKRVLGGVLDKNEALQEPQRSDSSQYQFEQLKAKMLSSRSELAALLAQKSAMNNQKESVDGAHLPKANLALNHNIYEEEKRSATAITQPKSETVARLTLSWNLYNGGATKQKSEQLQLQSLMIEERVSDLKLELEYQLQAAFSDLSLAQKSLVVASKAYESAQRSYDAVNDKFQQGVADNTDLLDAREDLTKSLSDLNSAKYGLLLANATLERVIGE